MRSSCLIRLLFLLPCALLAQPDRITAPIDARRTVVLKGNVHPMAQPRFDQGAVEPAFRLSYVTLMLKKTDAQQAALGQLLQQQQDPASPNYHDWLTPEQYADRFGLSQSDLDKISAWLQSEGFIVEYVARGRNWLAFSGTAGQVQAAFETEIHRYRVDGEMHFANATAPSIPAALEGVTGVIQGLDDFRLKPPPKRPPLAGFHPDFTDSNGSHYLAPGDLATIYDINGFYNHGLDGKGQKIAVVGQSNINMSDVESFRSTFGLPKNDPQMVLVQNSADPGVTADLDEANLDLDWTGAVAYNATVLYVYSTNVWTSLTYAVDQNLAPVISMSYGGCEQMISSTPAPAASYVESVAQQANSQGITWLASSGDSGAADCDADSSAAASNGLGVNIPASVPEVTGVGGTEFNEGSGHYWNSTNSSDDSSALSYIPEMAWNDSASRGDLSSSGGGASLFFPKPSWQTGTGVPNDGARDVPDVAFTASADHDGYIIVAGGQTMPYGGTSASTPVFAGIVALLNQYVNPSKPGLGNINPTLYRVARSNAAGVVFHDVPAGSSNIVPCVAGSPNCSNGSLGFRTGTGYDQVTGLGSIDAYNLATNWNVTPVSATTTTVTANPASFTIGNTTVLTARVANSTGGATPTGSVTFAVGSAVLGSVALDNSGSASVTVYGSQLTAGSNKITASYGGGANFSPSSSSVTVTVTVPTANSAVIPSVVPNPVYQQAADADGYSWFYTVRLAEIAGVATTLTGFSIDTNDDSASIASWFGSSRIPAHGTLSAAIRSKGLSVPVTRSYLFSGVDDSGTTWSQKVSVPFYGQQLSASMALTSSPATVLQNANASDPKCQYYQQVNVQEQNGYEVQLTRFVAAGFDLTSDIQTWFGSWRLAPLGTLQAGLCWPSVSPPATFSYEIDGTDTTGHKIVATASVPFQGPATNPGALSVSPASVAMSASSSQTATSSVKVSVPTGQQWTVSVFPANQKTSWLVVFPLSGTGPATVNLVASAGGVANGAYTATLVVQSTNTIPQFVNVPLTFTIGASSAITIGGVAHGASYQHVYAPGMLVSVFGTNLAAAGTQQLASTLPLPLTLAGVSVTVDGIAAPLLYVSPLQLNIQIPYETTTGTALLAVRNNNGQVATYSFQVSASAPGLFTQNQQGTGPITATSSGHRGQEFALYVTGAGEVSPPIATGAVPTGTQVPVPLLPVSVTVGGVAATLDYIGRPSWSVGTLQVNFTVPQNAPLGAQPVVVTVGTAVSPVAVTFTVQ
jgi:uncharacterized protein (TIGR03437 family)